eukprot:3009728-Pyramimonas_sp.AAC.1
MEKGEWAGPTDGLKGWRSGARPRCDSSLSTRVGPITCCTLKLIDWLRYGRFPWTPHSNWFPILMIALPSVRFPQKVATSGP